MSGAHRSAQAIVLEERHEEQWKPEEPPPLNHQPDHTNDVLPPMAIPLTIGLLVVAGLKWKWRKTREESVLRAERK